MTASKLALTSVPTRLPTAEPDDPLRLPLAARKRAPRTQSPTAESDEDALDDPVRAYLREIGAVDLLTGADERVLARQIEEGSFIDQLRAPLFGPGGETADSADLTVRLFAELARLRPIIAATER